MSGSYLFSLVIVVYYSFRLIILQVEQMSARLLCQSCQLYKLLVICADDDYYYYY